MATKKKAAKKAAPKKGAKKAISRKSYRKRISINEEDSDAPIARIAKKGPRAKKAARKH